MGLPYLNGSARLLADPEVRVSRNSGRKTVLLDLMFDSKKRDRRTGEWVQGDFFRVTGSVFGTDADDAEELRAGDEVVVTGRMKTDSYTDPATHETTLTSVMFVDTLGITVKTWATPDDAVATGT